MPIGNLLKSQSNEIYLAIVEGGWKVTDFDWDWDESSRYQFIHKDSGFYFFFETTDVGFDVFHTPGQQTIEDSYPRGSWNSLFACFESWLQYLSREVNAPDLWAELPSETELIESTSSENDNSKFNEEESKLIVKGMEEIKQYLLTVHKLDPELIEGQLKYLVESSERLGRKDWKNALIAVLFSIIIEGGIAGHTAQEIFQFVWTILQSVLIQKVYLP